MKITKNVKYVIAFILLVCIGFLTHNIIAQNNQQTIVATDVDVKITIDTKTSDSEISEIIEMLSENGINGNFRNIKRNDFDEIISVSIELNSGNGQTVASTMSNNLGIGEITFGRKDGELYIGSDDNMPNSFAFFNMPNIQSFQFDNDSIMKHHFRSYGNFNFDDIFGDENGLWSGDADSESIQELIERMQSRFHNFNHGTNNKRFSFVDDPDTDKLIIIDGKESDFETLDKLAKEDKLEAVDFLKSKTAISVYGIKAQDGAVIATTRKMNKQKI